MRKRHCLNQALAQHDVELLASEHLALVGRLIVDVLVGVVVVLQDATLIGDHAQDRR